MQNNILLNFTDLHDAQITELNKKLPLNTCESYKPADDENGHHVRVKSPAVLIEIAEMSPGENRGDGRMAFECEMVYHCILSTMTKNVELEIRNFAAAVAQTIKNNKFGLGRSVTSSEDIHLYPGLFKSGDKGFESWVVVAKQTVYIGEINQEPDFLPTNALFGFAPEIGLAHEANYIGTRNE
jgi:hypothetical protein